MMQQLPEHLEEDRPTTSTTMSRTTGTTMNSNGSLDNSSRSTRMRSSSSSSVVSFSVATGDIESGNMDSNSNSNSKKEAAASEADHQRGQRQEQQATTTTKTKTPEAATTNTTTTTAVAVAKQARQAKAVPQAPIIPPRLVLRNLPYHQSHNRIQVQHNQSYFKIYRLLRYDWFHVILELQTYKSLLVLLSVWTAMILVFAGLYVWFDNTNPKISCGLGVIDSPIEFGPAFAFSLETCTTVGYGLPNGTNSFFENCPGLQVLIYFQMIWSMMFNAFLFAFFYSRLAKCDARGAQVVLSRKAIVTMVDGQPRFQVRVYDVDAASPVVESHVRLYALTKDRPVPRPLRIINPDDELGGMLFMSLPAVISHQIDLYSMLHPPEQTPVATGGLLLRQADSINGSRDEFICPICGESYGTYERWRKHVLYQRLVETKDDYPVQGTHLSLNKSDFRPSRYATKFNPTLDIKELEDYFERELSEVICVVEGIEPIGSGTFSALQSYRFEDIVFNAGASFRPCVEAVVANDAAHNKGIKGGDYIRICLDRFHEIDIDEAVSNASYATRKKLADEAKRSRREHDSFFTTLSISPPSLPPSLSNVGESSEDNNDNDDAKRFVTNSVCLSR